MPVPKALKITAAVALLSTIAAVDVLQLTLAAPLNASAQEMLIARRRRLKFRVGVRPARYRVGGFSRSAVCDSGSKLTALVPPPHSQERVSNKESAVDRTTAEHPIFFVHLPQLPATTAQFTLQNEAGTEQLHSVKFDVTGKPGVVGIVLPKSKPGLKVGQKYIWQVAVTCNPNDSSSNIIVSNWVERVPAPAGSGTDVTALAEKGIWQDTVAQLALERFQKPADRATAEDWAALMEDAGLTQFKQSAVIQIVRN